MKNKQASITDLGSRKKLLDKRVASWLLAVVLGLLGFTLALRLAGPASIASQNDAALTDGRITVEAGDWYGQKALFFEITGEHSNIAFGYLSNPKKQICETVTGIRYWDLYTAPTRPEPIYDENGSFTGQYKELEPARQSGSYKRVKGGTKYLCLRVTWGDYREGIGYGSFYGPFSYNTGLLVETGKPAEPTPPPAPPPAFSLLTGQSHSPDGTKIRVTATRSGAANIGVWEYLVADADAVSINSNEDCQQLFNNSSVAGILVTKRAMAAQANSAYADISPEYSEDWICIKAVSQTDGTVYTYARLIEHTGEVQVSQPVARPQDNEVETNDVRNQNTRDNTPPATSDEQPPGRDGNPGQNDGSAAVDDTAPGGGPNLAEEPVGPAQEAAEEPAEPVRETAEGPVETMFDQSAPDLEDEQPGFAGPIVIIAAVLGATSIVVILGTIGIMTAKKHGK